jgi:putative spermidine/putrescine transport system substrate-binding protein
MSEDTRPDNKTLTRREMLTGTAALTVSVVVPGVADAATPKLVSTIFGGRFEKEYRKAIADPFEQEHGVEVVLNYGNAGQWLTNAMVNQPNPEIDIVFLVYPESVKAVHEGIGMELTPEELPNVVDVYDAWYEGFNRRAVGLDYASFGIAYRTDMVDAPTSWADLWDPKFKGKLAMPDLTASGSYQVLVMAAKINGGDENNIDPGFEAMKRLRPNVRKFFKSNPEAAQLFERGEVVAGGWYDGRTWGLHDNGVPLQWVAPKEGAMIGMASFHIAKNTKHPDLCKKYVNWAISPKAQEDFCSNMGYGPVNKKAKLRGKAAERVPSLDQLLLLDWFAVEPKMGEWLERWNREII